MNKNTKRKTAFFCCVILSVAAFFGGNHYSVFAETITQDLVEIDDGFYERLEDDEISLTGIENNKKRKAQNSRAQFLHNKRSKPF